MARIIEESDKPAETPERKDAPVTIVQTITEPKRLPKDMRDFSRLRVCKPQMGLGLMQVLSAFRKVDGIDWSRDRK